MTSSEPLARYRHPILVGQVIDGHGCPSFLRRNIRQVVDEHQIELSRIRSKKTGRETRPIATKREMPMSTFDAPDADGLQAAIEVSSPKLRIVPGSLERWSIKYAPDQKPTRQSSPEWLPTSGKLAIAFSAECTTSRDSHGEQSLFHETKFGTLTKNTDTNGQIRFTVDLNEPFVIEAKKLYPEEQDRASARTIKFKITFENLDDAKEFESETGIEKSSKLKTLELQVKWHTFPRCPPKDSSMNSSMKVTFIRNDVREPLVGWVFRPDIAWSKRRGTALEVWNQTLRSLKTGLSSSTVLIEGRTSDEQKTHHVLYVLMDKCLRQDTLGCIFCGSRPPDLSFERLHFHYLTCHNNLSFRVVDRTQDIDVGKPEKAVFIDLAESQHEHASHCASDDGEIHWIRPSYPFDIKSYLDREDRSWVDFGSRAVAQSVAHEDHVQQASRKRPVTTTERARGASHEEAIQGVSQKSPETTAEPAQGVSREEPTPQVSQGYPTITTEPLLDTLAYESVSNFPVKEKKRFVVPKVAGTIFFRTSSKRVLQPGEVVEESDGEVDDLWLHERRVHQYGPAHHLHTTNPMGRVIDLYNAHMRLENPLGIRYLPQAVMRFCCKHAELLSQPKLLLALEAKLDHMRYHHDITEKDIATCLDIVRSNRIEKRAVRHPSKNTQIVNGTNGASDDVEMVDGIESDYSAAAALHTPRDTRAAATQHGPIAIQSNRADNSVTNKNGEVYHASIPLRNGVCICGRPCTTARGIIYCADTQCPRSEFHMKCVGLTARVMGWKCSSCRPAVQGPVAPVALV